MGAAKLYCSCLELVLHPLFTKHLRRSVCVCFSGKWGGMLVPRYDDAFSACSGED